ncbi:MAG: hypothetical protein VCA74_03950 [Deltaproteobacteria bacterium]
MTDPPARPLGNETITAQLERLAAGSGSGQTRLQHAIIMAGRPGIGKFKTALWWAARLKCRQGVACTGTCPDCRQIAAGSHADLIVLEPAEAAKAIAIAETRDLIRRMAFKPLRPGPRIAIIKEAGRLSLPAQSSLLKLLEEPPGFAVIVLVADNPSSLLPTIRSRCRLIRFGPLTDDTVTDILAQAGRSPDLARRAALASRGSAGRALAHDEESLDERRRLFEDFEEFSSRQASPEGLAERLIQSQATHSNEGPGLEDLLEWQVAKVRASLGWPVAAESDVLDAALGTLGRNDTRRLLAEAELTRTTMRSLLANANAKLAIKNLLISMASQ